MVAFVNIWSLVISDSRVYQINTVSGDGECWHIMLLHYTAAMRYTRFCNVYTRFHLKQESLLWAPACNPSTRSFCEVLRFPVTNYKTDIIRTEIIRILILIRIFTFRWNIWLPKVRFEVITAVTLLLVYLLIFFFDFDDRVSAFLRKVGKLLPHLSESHPGRYILNVQDNNCNSAITFIADHSCRAV